MEDFEIVDLYWDRNERAITETDVKYGKYCNTIAYNILAVHEDSEECVNDTWLKTWETIPTQKPERLGVYVGKICRNIALNLKKRLTATKRGGNQLDLCLEELTEVVGKESPAEENIQLSQLTEAINSFLSSLDEKSRNIFVQRYWYVSSIEEIANNFSLSKSNVKTILYRTREKLREHLFQEGFEI